ncbi:MAG: hypothetical protein V7L05_17715 [Nostoc sp.]
MSSGQHNVNLPAYRRDRLKFKDSNKFLIKKIKDVKTTIIYTQTANRRD